MASQDFAPSETAQLRLQALTDFVAVVSGARGHDGVLRQVAVASRETLRADSVTLSIWDRARGGLRPVAADPEDAAAAVDLVPESGVRALLIDREGYRVPQAGTDPAHLLALDRLRRAGAVSAVAVPVVVDGDVWGELWAARGPSRRPYGAADLQFARTVADHAAPAVRQAEHLGDVERLAYTDPLTRLPNRRAFEDRLDRVVAEHLRDGTGIGLIVADINKLKDINDSGGHVAGDAALMKFAELLAELAASTPGCTPARLGGDEFALLCGGSATGAARSVADRLATRAAEVLPHGAACGLALTDGLTDAGLTPARILRAADAAQYRAKHEGTAQPVVVNSEFLAGSVPAGDRRRRFRDRDDPTLLEQLLGLLDGLTDEATAGRLLALAEAAAQALAVPGWRVLQVRPEGAAVVGASPARADAPLPEANELWRTVRSGGRVQVSADEVVLTAGGASGPQAGWVMELSGWAPAAEPARHLAEVRAALALALADRGC